MLLNRDVMSLIFGFCNEKTLLNFRLVFLKDEEMRILVTNTLVKLVIRRLIKYIRRKKDNLSLNLEVISFSEKRKGGSFVWRKLYILSKCGRLGDFYGKYLELIGRDKSVMMKLDMLVLLSGGKFNQEYLRVSLKKEYK